LRLAAAATAPRFSHPPLPAFGFAPPTTLEPIVATSVFGAAPVSLNAVCMDPPPSIDELYEATILAAHLAHAFDPSALSQQCNRLS